MDKALAWELFKQSGMVDVYLIYRQDEKQAEEATTAKVTQGKEMMIIK